MTNACDGVFNSNVLIFDSNCAEGLHFSAFFINSAFGFRVFISYTGVPEAI